MEMQLCESFQVCYSCLSIFSIRQTMCGGIVDFELWCALLQSHHSAVFQVTSAATVFFPPGSSIDQQGSVLVSPRTWQYFCLPFSCVLLQYWVSTLMYQWLNTLDSKEIYSQVLAHLPDLQLLTSDNFEVRRRNILFSCNSILQNISIMSVLFPEPISPPPLAC